MPSLKMVSCVALVGFITSVTIHVCALLVLDLFLSGLVHVLCIGNNDLTHRII